MSSSIEARLAYGVNLGGDEDGWNFAEVGEYGGMTDEWLVAHGADEDSYGTETVVNTLKDAILRAGGFSEPEPDYQLPNGETNQEWLRWLERRAEAEKLSGVEVDWCGDMGTGFSAHVLVITSTKHEASWTETSTFEPSNWHDVHPDFDAKLGAVLQLAGLSLHDVKPGWILYAYYG
jgi:hypothetical protein